MVTARMAGRLCIGFMFFAGFAMNCAPPRSTMLRNHSADHRYRADVPVENPENVEFRWEDSDGGDPVIFDDDSMDEYEPESGSNADIRLHSDKVRYDTPSRSKLDDILEEDDTPASIRSLRRHETKKPLTKDTRNGTKIAVYRVKKKDTLYGLSKRFGCDIDELLAQNGLKRADSIKTGMKLQIPHRASTNLRKNQNLKSPRTESGKKSIFIWPVKSVLAVKRDSIDGVKPIGIRISGKSGAPVVSSASGVVKKIGEMRGYGKYIIIEHDDRYVTVYAKVRDIRVAEGENISSGRVIANMGKEEKAIHFQIGHEGRPVDPLRYLPGKS